MNKTAKTKILGNLVELDMLGYKTIREAVLFSEIRDTFGNSHIKQTDNLYWQFAIMLSSIQDIHFLDDNEYLDTYEQRLIDWFNEQSNTLKEDRKQTEKNKDIEPDVKQAKLIQAQLDDIDARLAKLETQRTAVLSEDEKARRHHDAMLARDTLRNYWENKNGNLANNWELFQQLHEVIPSEIFRAYNETQLQLPKGNQKLTSKPNPLDPDPEVKKNT